MLDIGRDAMTMALPEHVSNISAMLRPCRAASGRVLGTQLGSVPVAQPTSSPDQPLTGEAPASTGDASASLARRFGALLVDWTFCLLVAGLFARPRRDGWAPPLVLLAEYTFFLGLFTQTPGMWLLRIRCVDVATAGRLGLFRAALRGALLCLLVPALIMDKRQRGLHDRVAGSVVVEVPRGGVSGRA
jgi:uncharacterized RDD family membrane protein YckC